MALCRICEKPFIRTGKYETLCAKCYGISKISKRVKRTNPPMKKDNYSLVDDEGRIIAGFKTWGAARANIRHFRLNKEDKLKVVKNGK